MKWTKGPRSKNIEDRRNDPPPVNPPSEDDSLVAGMPATSRELELYREALAARDSYLAGRGAPAVSPAVAVEQARQAALSPPEFTGLRSGGFRQEEYNPAETGPRRPPVVVPANTPKGEEDKLHREARPDVQAAPKPGEERPLFDAAMRKKLQAVQKDSKRAAADSFLEQARAAAEARIAAEERQKELQREEWRKYLERTMKPQASEPSAFDKKNAASRRGPQ
jgi:hypothetical protein